MIRRARLLVLSLALFVVVTACGGDDSSSSPSEPGVVHVKDNVFEPKKTTVGVGDTVTWRFDGKSAHNVTFDDFNSKLMKTGEFRHTFDEAGTFKFTCTIHTGMAGTVEVSDSAAP